MKFIATRCTPPELNAGDLFSTAGPAYWEHFDEATIGQKVYVRTVGPIPEGEEDLEIYRIEFVLEDATAEERWQGDKRYHDLSNRVGELEEQNKALAIDDRLSELEELTRRNHLNLSAVDKLLDGSIDSLADSLESLRGRVSGEEDKRDRKDSDLEDDLRRVDDRVDELSRLLENLELRCSGS